jgi:hypothetical protein
VCQHIKKRRDKAFNMRAAIRSEVCKLGAAAISSNTIAQGTKQAENHYQRLLEQANGAILEPQTPETITVSNAVSDDLAMLVRNDRAELAKQSSSQLPSDSVESISENRQSNEQLLVPQNTMYIADELSAVDAAMIVNTAAAILMDDFGSTKESVVTSIGNVIGALVDTAIQNTLDAIVRITSDVGTARKVDDFVLSEGITEAAQVAASHLSDELFLDPDAPAQPVALSNKAAADTAKLVTCAQIVEAPMAEVVKVDSSESNSAALRVDARKADEVAVDSVLATSENNNVSEEGASIAGPRSTEDTVLAPAATSADASTQDGEEAVVTQLKAEVDINESNEPLKSETASLVLDDTTSTSDPATTERSASKAEEAEPAASVLSIEAPVDSLPALEPGPVVVPATASKPRSPKVYKHPREPKAVPTVASTVLLMDNASPKVLELVRIGPVNIFKHLLTCVADVSAATRSKAIVLEMFSALECLFELAEQNRNVVTAASTTNFILQWVRRAGNFYKVQPVVEKSCALFSKMCLDPTLGHEVAEMYVKNEGNLYTLTLLKYYVDLSVPIRKYCTHLLALSIHFLYVPRNDPLFTDYNGYEPIVDKHPLFTKHRFSQQLQQMVSNGIATVLPKLITLSLHPEPDLLLLSTLLMCVRFVVIECPPEVTHKLIEVEGGALLDACVLGLYLRSPVCLHSVTILVGLVVSFFCLKAFCVTLSVLPGHLQPITV